MSSHKCGRGAVEFQNPDDNLESNTLQRNHYLVPTIPEEKYLSDAATRIVPSSRWRESKRRRCTAINLLATKRPYTF